MELKPMGGEKFKLKTKKLGVVVDVSCTENTTRVEITKTVGDKEEVIVFDRPGEYEVAGVGMSGIRTENNPIFVIHAEEMSVVYLGRFDNELTDKQKDDLGPVDVLIAPATAVKIAKALSPSIVVPFGSETEVEDLLEKMGQEKMKQDKLALNKVDLPEGTQVILLA